MLPYNLVPRGYIFQALLGRGTYWRGDLLERWFKRERRGYIFLICNI
jgi:hypothetical protein